MTEKKRARLKKLLQEAAKLRGELGAEKRNAKLSPERRVEIARAAGKLTHENRGCSTCEPRQHQSDRKLASAFGGDV